MTYIYLSTDWPQFAWNAELVVPRLSATRYEQGLLLGRMKGLGYQLKNEATLAALTEETVKSSAIEGEELAHISHSLAEVERSLFELAVARKFCRVLLFG